MSRRITLPLTMLALAAGAVGCAATQDGPATGATPSSTAAGVLFNPCTQIPDDALRAAGVDPATEEAGIAGVHQSGWEICSWDGPEYIVTVFSTGRSVPDFERKPGNVEFKDVTVAGRQGRQFKVEGATKDLGCDVLFPAAQGVIQMRILNRSAALGDQAGDSCVLLYRAGESIVPTFPH